MLNTTTINKIWLTLYLLVAFIPSLGTQDGGITQWLYLAILNSVCAGYIFVKRKEYDLFLTRLMRYVIIGSILFLAVSLVSITQARLVSESIVALMYFIVVLCSFVLLYFIVKKQPQKYFLFVTGIVLVAASIEVYQVCDYFFSNNAKPRSNELIKGLVHNYGNINILAVSIAMKFPFLVYGFLVFKNKWLKYLCLPLFLGVVTALLLVGARTAVFSSVMLLVALWVYFLIVGQAKKQTLLHDILPLVSIVFVGVFLSLNANRIHKHQLNSFHDLFFTKPLKKLYVKKFKEDKRDVTSSSGRDALWEAAVIAFKEKPLLGVGVGNWKLVEKKTYLKRVKKKTASSPKRVHNDFLQILSEIGIVGFVLYLGFFIVVICVCWVGVFNNKHKETALIYAILSASFLIYSLDAFFNFPHERPPVQLMLFLLVAFMVCFKPLEEAFKKTKQYVLVTVFPVLLIGGLVVSYLVFSASSVQRTLQLAYEKKDMFKGTYDITYEEVCKMLPSFPELDARARPNEIIKAIFAINQHKDKKALKHLDKSIKQSPYIAENYSFKAMLFLQGDKAIRHLDSALYYAGEAFYIQPSMKIGYNVLRNIHDIRKDSLSMFYTYTTFLETVPNDIDSWIDKANYFKKIGKSKQEIMEVIDEAIALNPLERKLKIYKEELKGIKNNTRTEKDITSGKFTAGVNLYNAGNYQAAKQAFLTVVKRNPMHYSGLLYAGLTEIHLKEYKNAIYYLTKVIDAKQINNGYLEYNRGIAYNSMGDAAKALKDFKVSKDKGYAQATDMIAKLEQVAVGN